jgi:hypothetical protein
VRTLNSIEVYILAGGTENEYFVYAVSAAWSSVVLKSPSFI